MNIKDLPENERPKEKLIYSGAEHLSTSELLALVIRTGTNDKSAVQLAEEVISFSNSEIGSLGRAEVRELMKVDGIGETKACSIVASMELARRLQYRTGGQHGIRLQSTKAVAELLMDELRYEKREHVVALLLNAKCEIESKVTVSIGELSNASLHPRELFSQAIRRGAAAMVIAHNHPSGDPEPSDDDIIVTMRLVEAASIIGIEIYDHLIIGDGRYVSMKDMGYI